MGFVSRWVCTKSRNSFLTIPQCTNATLPLSVFTLEFCTLSYVETADDIELAKKMRKLVASLSSYKIAFIDGDEEERYTDSTAALVSGSASNVMTIVSKEYVAPIMDSVCNPHIACYEIAEDGFIMMRTADTHAVEGKVYYEVVNTQTIDPDLEEDLVEVGEDMEVDVVDTLCRCTQHTCDCQ